MKVLSGKGKGSHGSSLMEMVVVLAILSILAAMATPYARKSFKRDKEIQLRETLRTVRIAIDRFHADWETAAAAKRLLPGASADGFPISLQVLVEGTGKGDSSAPSKRYLRSLPVNPFAPPGTPLSEQWTLISYQSGGNLISSSSYGATLAEVKRLENDVYDLHAVTSATAMDGTPYAEW